ncbi:hypothetical protein JYT91_01340 [archaeon AH-315-M20]|nr:hypothetical protein [archaeon AH-315-M20]
MIKRKIKFVILFLVLLLISISGCDRLGGQGSAKGSGTGTEGITINFLENSPQDSYLVSSEDEEPISVIVEVRNKGAYPQEEDENILSRGKIHISGFDRDIIRIEPLSKSLRNDYLLGVSSINPEGGFDTAEFEGFISPDKLVVDKYEPTILATLCYPYKTKASPTVCIDPSPFDDKQKKVCRIGSTQLSSQGAPITITSIDQEASSNKIQFKLNIKNEGDGDIIRINALKKCDPYGDTSLDKSEILERKDFDRVELIRATVGFSELECGPLDEGRFIRLFNGEGFVLCSLDRASFEEVKTAYTTPLNIELKYGYRSTISKPIKISKISSVS